MRTATALVVTGLVLAGWWSPALAAVLAGYLALQAAYSLSLKHRPGLDLVTVALGFVLRVLAGGVAAGVEVSAPFLVVVGFAALFMVAGKRFSEMHTLGAAAGTRRSLTRYSLRSLRLAWTGSAVTAVAGYAVAATGLAAPGTTAAAWAVCSVPAFAAGVVRYAGHVRQGAAGCPEAVVFGDRVLQVLGATWAVTVVAAVALA